MNKIALITGGSSGLGKAMADALADKDWLVYAAARNIPDIMHIERIRYCELDVTDNKSINKCVNQILEQHHKIDLLINNAGIGVAAALEEISPEEIQQAFDINLFGVHRMVRAVVPSMRENGRGSIINMSSIAGQVGLPFQGVYSASKFALEGYTEALRIELSKFGISVCMIQPGDYKTNVHKNRKVCRPGKSSPYASILTHFFDIINSNIENGRDPKKLGKLAVKIANKKHPRLRYKSGRIFEVITPYLKNILPSVFFGKILKIFYKL